MKNSIKKILSVMLVFVLVIGLTNGLTIPVKAASSIELLRNTEFSSDAYWDEWTENDATFKNNANGSITIHVPAYDEGNYWSTQVLQKPIALYEDKEYVAKCTIKSNVTRKYMFIIQNVTYDFFQIQESFTLKAGESKTLQIKFKASQTDNFLFGVMMGYMGEHSPKATVTVSNVSLTTTSKELLKNRSFNGSSYWEEYGYDAQFKNNV